MQYLTPGWAMEASEHVAGAKIPTAADVMVRRVHTIRSDADIDRAVRLLLQHGHSGAPVVDADGVPQGVLSEHDCIRVLAQTLADRRPEGHVSAHMTTEIETVPASEDILAIAGRFASGRHRRLLVIDDGRLVGLISRSDLLRALQELDRRMTRGRKPSTYDAMERRHRDLD
jgi:CBS domain-containing protein